MLNLSMVVKTFTNCTLCERMTMFGRSKVPIEIFSNFTSFKDKINIDVLSHEVHCVKFCNHAKNKRGTLAKLLTSEKVFSELVIVC